MNAVRTRPPLRPRRYISDAAAAAHCASLVWQCSLAGLMARGIRFERGEGVEGGERVIGRVRVGSSISK